MLKTILMLLQMMIPPFLLYSVSLLSTQLNQCHEFTLILIHLVCTFIIFFPKLRSQLIRRRLMINTWLREESLFRKLLQGGTLYSALTLVIVLPFALILVAEIQHIQVVQWHALILIMLIVSIGKFFIRYYLNQTIYTHPASVLSREWMTKIFIVLAIPCISYLVLYIEKPNVQGVSLEQFIEQTGVYSDHLGLLENLQMLSVFKEDMFWWTFLNLPALMMHFPTWMIQVAHYSLLIIYMLYSVSVVYLLSKLCAGFLEIVDPCFYQFIKDPIHAYQLHPNHVLDLSTDETLANAEKLKDLPAP